MTDIYCPHCGVEWAEPQGNPVCDDCYDAMYHFRPPTRRCINGQLIVNHREERRILGYYDVNTGQLFPVETQ